MNLFKQISVHERVSCNEGFLSMFAKIHENNELMLIDEFSDLVNEIYTKMRINDDNFEKDYLKQRRSILDIKDKFKEERKQLAITDPAKWNNKVCRNETEKE